MLEIYFKDGSCRIWKKNQFTDYEYMKDIFVVLKDATWVGMYSMDCIKSVEYIIGE